MLFLYRFSLECVLASWAAFLSKVVVNNYVLTDVTYRVNFIQCLAVIVIFEFMLTYAMNPLALFHKEEQTYSMIFYEFMFKAFTMLIIFGVVVVMSLIF